VEPSRLEQAVMARTRRAKLFVWLRQHRHELLDEGFQAELAGMYADQKVGQPPTPPALLALVTILQAYTGASDAEAVEASVMDRRWQLVLDCMDQAQAPFSKATLVAFRGRLIAAELDRRLVERTVSLYAEAMGVPAARQVRVALDSSPLWGAGRVEDTINLVGHALRKVLGVLARQQGWGLAQGLPVVAEQAGVKELAASSLKAALDLDWDDPAALEHALGVLLVAVGRVEGLAAEVAGGSDSAVANGLAAARQVRDQDVVGDEQGVARIRQGVAKDRRISIEDAQMRHGRKTRSVRVDGYKRHVARDLDAGLVRAVGVTPANVPEAKVADQIHTDLAHQDAHLSELHIDRAYLASSLVADRDPDLAIYCKAFPVRNGPRFAKTAFTLDFAQGLLTCPNQVRMPFTPGGKVQFPAPTCQACPLRAQCTTSTRGRSVQIHPDEQLLAELRARQLTPQGRARLRERVQVEHSLAHIGGWQGRRARYRGTRKNLFDLRRYATVHNLHVTAHQVQPATPSQQAA
jgi:transposase